MTGKRIKLSGAASRKLALEKKLKNALVLSQVPKLQSYFITKKTEDLTCMYKMLNVCKLIVKYPLPRYFYLI